LETLTIPLERTPSESEIRVAQAQLVGWLEGLLHGIKAAMWAHQMEAQAQLEEMQRRGLPGGQSMSAAELPEDRAPGGQYL
jgi:Bacterial proteasome activator